MTRSTATLPSPSRPARFVVVANPESRRLALFQSALARLNLPPAQVLSYQDLLAGRDTLERLVQPGTLVRVESPGQNFEVEKALLVLGADVPDTEGPTRISRDQARALVFDRGRILYPRQWFLGFREVLRRLDRQLAACPGHRLLNSLADIETMFDKCRCHDLFTRHGIPVPRSLGLIRSYGELRERMSQTGRRRVFVKLAHGSSASGVVAYETAGPREQAFTTVEMVRQNGTVILYNSRRIRRYTRREDIAVLVDSLAREGVQVEEWVPKAGLRNRRCDVRVVVIAGRARHVVVRLSDSPMTNLHLKNERAGLDLLLTRMDGADWATAQRTCERAAGVFPGSLYAGVDLVIAPGYQRHAVVEINAFGDLLPGVLCDGMDTHTAEIVAMVPFPWTADTSLKGQQRKQGGFPR
ncbi:MAG: STM4014 family protein [Planctomycetes bacterium]|nr:STM4014 family protein [Planctomycetota bacterium]